MNNVFLARNQEEEVIHTDNEASVAGSVAGDDDASHVSNIASVHSGADAADAADAASVQKDVEKPDMSETGYSDSEEDGSNGKGDGEAKDGAEEEQPLVEKNPWTKPYIGIPINYFSVGIIYGGSVSVLYPLLVVQHGVTSSFYAAASSLVTLFWSYKILFGALSDCFPVWGLKWKPYIVAGWILCALMLVVLAFMGNGVDPINLVLLLTFANLGYVMADVAADGYMVWMAHHEPPKRRGSIQSLIYISRSIGRIMINIVIIFAFSGPMVNCAGYQPDKSVPCTTDEDVASRNSLFEENPEDWCYQVCPEADFGFGLSVPQFAWIIAAINIVSIPSYFWLHEDKKVPEKVGDVLSKFWVVMKRRAVWQVMLYTMISSITFNVFIAAKSNANYTWLKLSTAQNQIVNMMESLIFTIGLAMIRKWGLNFSWRKMIWIGSFMVTVFNAMYLLIAFDIYRNPYFYMFTDVSDTFLYTLNFMASVFAIVEVSEPGFEAITYSLITTANNATIPLSVVISFQFMALFPKLNTQEGLAEDTPEVRGQFGLLILIVEAINLSSLFCLPMLPRQKEESRELVKQGEESAFWAKFTLISASIFLVYSTIATFATVGAADSVGCLKILGGGGCTDDESSVPVYLLMGACFLYCYGVNFYFTIWPIITGQKKFSFSEYF